jgi:hypothetical protein
VADYLNAHQAEACFHQALAIARHQEAKALELRAVMSLARPWQRQGKQSDARRILADIYGCSAKGLTLLICGSQVAVRGACAKRCELPCGGGIQEKPLNAQKEPEPWSLSLANTHWMSNAGNYGRLAVRRLSPAFTVLVHFDTAPPRGLKDELPATWLA